jgi:hypothetical protein
MPAAPLTTTTAEVFIEDNVFILTDPNDPDTPLYTGNIHTPDTTGLLATAPGAVQVTCGVHLGNVTITVEVWPETPPTDLDDWDDAAEVSVTWPTTDVEVIGAATDDTPGFPLTLPFPPGQPYRVRGQARNRDAGEDRDDTDPPEQHLLRIWPAPTAPDHLLKATDQIGALWRQPRP